MGNNSSKAPAKSEEDIIKENQLKYLENLEKKKKQEREAAEAKRKQEELGKFIFINYLDNQKNVNKSEKIETKNSSNLENPLQKIDESINNNNKIESTL